MRVVGKDYPLVFRTAGGTDLKRNVLDTSKISEHLGWHPLVPIEEGLRLTWDRILRCD